MATQSLTGLTSGWSPISAIFLIPLAIVVLTIIARHLLPSQSEGGIHDLGGIPILTDWNFFTKRHDFLWKQFNSGKKYFQFRILQRRVVASSGEDARKIFFHEPGLDLSEGMEILMGTSPQPENGEAKLDADLVKRLLLLLRKDRIVDLLPVLLDDINHRMKDWGNEGTINPFKEIFDVTFQMTVRTATCNELAEDKNEVKHLSQHYWDFEKGTSPMVLLFPWFPSQAKKFQEKASRAIFNLLYKYVDLRQKALIPSSDPIDTLIAHGDTNDSIVGVIMGIIFVGFLPTGATSCWILFNLGANPEWKSKVIKELKALLANHTNTIMSGEPIHKRLATIPLTAWEEELPMFDLVIRETLRITMCAAALRRNIGKDIRLGDTVIRKGDFATYSIADVHMNANIYTNPSKFDPGRFMKGREEDKKETLAYIGWGAGRHLCPGMRIAKLQMKLFLAMFLLGYEYELVDSKGDFPKELPIQDRNDNQQLRLLGDPCYLKFKRVPIE